MLAAILASRARTFKTFGNKNGYFQAAANLLRVRPWHRYAVFETGISRPGQMGPMARMVRPHVAIVLGLARVHTKGFHERSEYAAEKAELLRHIEPRGLGLRPLGRVPFVAEFDAGCFAVKSPIDLLPDAVHPAIPLSRLSAQGL